MNSKTDKSRNWLVFLTSVVVFTLIAVLGLLIWNSQAATPGPQPAVAFIQLDPTAGEPGTVVTIRGRGWPAGETVLVYLLETENGSTDGVVYGSAVADASGQIAVSIRYPQAGPWAGKQEAIVLVRTATSERSARAAFLVNQPTVEPDTPTPEPTDTPVPDTPVPATDTPEPVVPAPTATPIPPTPTPVPPTPTPKPVQITDWRGEYYSGINLAGTPKVRNDKKIDFDWGNGSPMKGIDTDQFSARWTRRLDFEAKTYRFSVRVDDGVRLWVDGKLLIDQWSDGSLRTYSVERTMTAGKHDIRVEMYERTGLAAITFWREMVESYPDWKGEYFGNVTLSGSPLLIRNDKGIDFNWGGGAPTPALPADRFSVRWTRKIQFPAGAYRFFVEVDDGVRLWVDGVLIIDQWHDGVGSYTGDAYLAEGAHTVHMEMYENAGDAKARMWWARQESFPEWKGEYFANRTLAGVPALARNDRSIDFNWGAGAPATGLPADNFSVRWTRKLDFPAGAYRFTVEVDDGARLWVDDRLVIDQWHDGIASYTGDAYLTEGKHQVRMEMYEHTGGAMARLGWTRLESFPEWKGEYFANRGLTGVPALVRNDKRIDFNWGAGAPTTGLPVDNFSVRWTRKLDFPVGAYRFTVEVDDGARLWVDDRLVIDQWHDGSASYTGDAYLTEGKHQIRMEMYEHTGGAMARLGWARLESFPEWKGEYFANRGLTGVPALVRNDKRIDFNWGAGAPTTGLPIDNFSVRWTRKLDFPAGAYRFTVEVDDGARLWVDGVLVIDQWHDGSGVYTGDIYLTEGKHQVRMEMYEHTGGAMARLGWARLESFTEWKGEYFANRELTGVPALVRNDKSIDFNWGAGAPATGLPIDNFSVRWTRKLDFPVGAYRFTVEVDDGARLWVDDRLVIDQWHDGSGVYTGDIYLTEGKHQVRMEMYDHIGGAMARLGWARLESFPEWKGEYFANRELTGVPALVRNDPEIDFDWGTGAPATGLPVDNFSVRWTRQIYFPVGPYRFTVEVDEGARLWVDDRLVIDQWDSGNTDYSGDVYLDEGKHQVRMEMYENTGNAKARLWWTLETNQADWEGSYYANREFEGEPALVRPDLSINFDWEAGAPSPDLPADDFSVRWIGYADFGEGTYQFCARADDGVSIEMNDEPPYIIREWHDGYGTYCNDLHIAAGRHKITVEYYDHLDTAMIQIWWQRLADG